jgi:hypothetical protein
MLPMTIPTQLSGCHGKTESVSILGQDLGKINGSVSFAMGH